MGTESKYLNFINSQALGKYQTALGAKIQSFLGFVCIKKHEGHKTGRDGLDLHMVQSFLA